MAIVKCFEKIEGKSNNETIETTFKVRRLADLILEEKRAKEAKEKHINEEISIRKKEEQNAKVVNKLVMISILILRHNYI